MKKSATWTRSRLLDLKSKNILNLQDIESSEVGGIGFHILSLEQLNLPAKVLVESPSDRVACLEAVFSSGSEAISALAYLLGDGGGFSEGAVIPAEHFDKVTHESWTEVI